MIVRRLSLVLAALLATSLAAPAAAAPAETPLVVKDAAGRTVKLRQAPQRILAIGEGTFMIVHLLAMFPEGRQRLVGMETRGRSASDFLPLVDADAAHKKLLDPNPGPEQIAGLHPDLVLLRGSVETDKSRALAAVGVPVVFLGTETPARYLEDIALLGRLLGNPARAEAVAAFYRDRLAAVSGALAGLEPTQRPRVLVAMAKARSGTVAMQVPARAWMQTQIVEAAGGSPVWLDEAAVETGWTVVTIEQIARWNPDRIFVVFWSFDDPRQALAELEADPHWAALAAVKNGRLHAFPGDLYGWDSPDPRFILGLEWAAATIHPERFPGFDAMAAVERFYGTVYGLDPAAVAAGILPAITADLR